MDFGQVSKYLDDCLIFGIKPSLVRIKKILELLGNLHKKKDFIHVVGTNGKTSTTAMAASIMHGQGISCGYHVSPHITSYTERFWSNGENISKKEFSSIFNKLYPYIQEVNKLDLDGPITQFEILTAMSFLFAEEKDLDVMVMEAGMGGRWDATNIADSLVVGFTGVSLEHTRILGNSITEIAKEKAEVIKEGAEVAVLSKDKKVLEVVKKKVASTGSRLYVQGKDFFIENIKDKGFGYRMDLKGIKDRYRNLELNLAGSYQAQNLLLAVALAELYMGKLDLDNLKECISEVKVEGRFQVMKKEPLVVADASHNPEGICKFAGNVYKYSKGKKKIIIFAVLKDKDYKAMLREIIKVADTLILTSSNNQRSLDIDSLESETLKIMENSHIKIGQIYKIDNIENSLNFALNIADSSDIICITGSITNLEHIV